MYQFRIHRSIITKFIPQALDAVYTVLKDDYLKCPTSHEDRSELAGQTYKRWQFPYPYAVADGKYTALFHPFHSASESFSIKKFFRYHIFCLSRYRRVTENDNCK